MLLKTTGSADFHLSAKVSDSWCMFTVVPKGVVPNTVGGDAFCGEIVVAVTSRDLLSKDAEPNTGGPPKAGLDVLDFGGAPKAAGIEDRDFGFLKFLKSTVLG